MIRYSLYTVNTEGLRFVYDYDTEQDALFAAQEMGLLKPFQAVPDDSIVILEENWDED